MRIFPVLDLMHGQVVRGIAGRRSEYRPLQSSLVASADPLAVARAIRAHFQLSNLYLADLDAIAGQPPALGTIKSLQSDGFTLLIDAGLRTAADAVPLLATGVSGIIAGLETLAGPEALADLIHDVGPARLVFSLDLKYGQPLATSAAWQHAEPWAIATAAITIGVQRLLVLDLARVGVGSGTGTEAFCARLKNTYPALDVLAGGGVRGRDHLMALRCSGVDGVLVASALHDGRLLAGDLG